MPGVGTQTMLSKWWDSPFYLAERDEVISLGPHRLEEPRTCMFKAH